MNTFRATIRLATYSVVTAACFLVWVAGLILAAWIPNWRMSWRCFMFRRWAQWVSRILGIRLQIVGTPPKPPFFLVTNHLGYLDIVLLASQLNTRFLGKLDVAGWPLLGPLGRCMGTVFIDRTSRRDLLRVNDELEHIVIREREGVVAFPEGTSSGGWDVLPFKPSILDFAARLEYPVHFASISYQTPRGEPHASEAVCWWGDMSFRGHFFNLLRLSAIDSKLVFGPNPIRASDRKTLASRLRESVTELFTPMNSPEPS